MFQLPPPCLNVCGSKTRVGWSDHGHGAHLGREWAAHEVPLRGRSSFTFRDELQ
jgi:hypothetical protein